MTVFYNRQSLHPNRKRLTIIQQNSNEIIADIENADEPTVAGTPITAEVMNNFQSEINTANQNSISAVGTANTASGNASTALSNSQTALTNSQAAVTTANTANTKADTAISTANAAQAKALEVESLLADGGTIVKINNVAQTTINFSSDPQTQIDNKLTNNETSIKASVLSLAYPVGSIYLSVNSTNPGTLFGGTWQQLTDRFLLGAGNTYTNGNTGGEASHTLTTNEIPSHTHTLGTASGSFEIAASGNAMPLTNNYSGFVTFAAQTGGNSSYPNTYSRDDASKANRSKVTLNHTHTIANSGSGQAHNNMPPYLVVYMWKRIA